MISSMPSNDEELAQRGIDPRACEQLISYLRELELGLEQRSGELRASERRYRELFEAEKKKTRELAMLAKIGEDALSHRDVNQLVAAAAQTISRSFSECSVAIFLVDASSHSLVLTGYSHNQLREPSSERLGYRQPLDMGIVGWVATHGEALRCNNVLEEPRFYCAFPEQENVSSELAVPIRHGDNIIGVIAVQSKRENFFDYRDQVVLQTVADQMATAIENIRLHNQTVLLKEFNQAVVSSFPSAVVVVDRSLNVLLANRTFCEEVGVEEDVIQGCTLESVLSPTLLYDAGLREALQDALEGEGYCLLENVTYTNGRGEECVVDIRVSLLRDSPESGLLITIRDETQRARQIAQLSLLHDMGALLQRSLDRDYLLYTLLTCITAGPALGFNRSVVFLLDERKENLLGAMAVGPLTLEEAHRIWAEVGKRPRALQELLDSFGPAEIEKTEIQRLARQMRVSLAEAPHSILARTVREQATFKVATEALRRELCYPYGEILHSREFATAPLSSGREVLGAVVADNAFNQAPIQEEDLRLLTTLCNQAGLALSHAMAHARVESHARELKEAYQRLREMHQELVRREKLSSVGEMAARVSHEIRNPLITIGGFARSMLKKPEDVERVREDASIIVQEVEELEEILGSMLDLARPLGPVCRPENINAILEHACLMARADFERYGVHLVKHLDEYLPEVFVDARQMRQALLNVIRNGIQAMPHGGKLTVSTAREEDGVSITICDEGPGIPPDEMDKIFTPFYTTKVQGTGLGLAVTRKILEDHRGSIEVHSQVGSGASFVLRIPYTQPLAQPS